MNRPKLQECLPKDEYVIQLEKYCNFIEWKLEATNEALNDHIKALDKTCEQLELMSEALYISREEWKEWSLNDD